MVCGSKNRTHSQDRSKTVLLRKSKFYKITETAYFVRARNKIFTANIDIVHLNA